MLCRVFVSPLGGWEEIEARSNCCSVPLDLGKLANSTAKDIDVRNVINDSVNFTKGTGR